MTEITIKKHNFDKAKNNIKQFSLTKPEELALNKVDVNGGLFNWFDHKVTGAELNSLTNQVQEYLIKFNNLHSKFIKEFGEVYNALEALDKEYIEGILISVKAAEKASMEAKDAQKDIKKTIEVQKHTLKALENFKNKLDKFQYLESIDEVWEDTQRFSVELRSILKTIQKLEDENIKNLKSIDRLNEFKSELFKQKHLNSIDVMWGNFQTAKQNIKSLEKNLDNCTTTIDSHKKTISSIKGFTDNLKKLEHVLKIDEIWDNTQSLKNDLEQIKEQIIQINQMALTHDQQIAEVINFIETLNNLQHLHDIDVMWEGIKENEAKSDLLQEKVTSLEQNLVFVNKQLSEQNERHENEIQQLMKRNKNIMLLSGSSLLLVIVLYILNIIGLV